MRWNALNFAGMMVFGVGILPVAFTSPTPGKNLGGIDIDDIQNKVRSGAIAIANSEQPFDERNKKVIYRNGDLVDTAIIEVPENELERRQVVNNLCPNRSPEDCAAEFPALAAAARNFNGTISYQCEGICPGLNTTAFEGSSCARVLGYFQVNPVSTLSNILIGNLAAAHPVSYLAL